MQVGDLPAVQQIWQSLHRQPPAAVVSSGSLSQRCDPVSAFTTAASQCAGPFVVAPSAVPPSHADSSTARVSTETAISTSWLPTVGLASSAAITAASAAAFAAVSSAAVAAASAAAFRSGSAAAALPNATLAPAMVMRPALLNVAPSYTAPPFALIATSSSAANVGTTPTPVPLNQGAASSSQAYSNSSLTQTNLLQQHQFFSQVAMANTAAAPFDMVWGQGLLTHLQNLEADGLLYQAAPAHMVQQVHDQKALFVVARQQCIDSLVRNQPNTEESMAAVAALAADLTTFTNAADGVVRGQMAGLRAKLGMVPPTI